MPDWRVLHFNTMFSLIAGGILGAATTTVVLGFMSTILRTSVFAPVYWLLLTVPFGVGWGVCLMWYVRSVYGWIHATWQIWLALGVAVFLGFPASFIAPIFVSGLGPRPLYNRVLMFVIEFVVLWGGLWWLAAHESGEKAEDSV